MILVAFVMKLNITFLLFCLYIFPFFPFSVCDLGSQAVRFLIMATVPFLFLTAVKKNVWWLQLKKGKVYFGSQTCDIVCLGEGAWGSL